MPSRDGTRLSKRAAGEVEMTEKVLIAVAIAAIFVRLIEMFPSIVWVFRCPADSPNFKHPPTVLSRLWRRR